MRLARQRILDLLDEPIEGAFSLVPWHGGPDADAGDNPSNAATWFVPKG